MAIQFGNDKIKAIYVGSDKIKEVYYGSEKVWDIRGYWVNKDTGVKTYFGLEDPSIVDGVMSSPYWKDNCSKVQIPFGVTGLADNCFRSCSSLTSITIPKGVTSLGRYCFRDCTSLSSINIPEGVTSLEEYCFRSCSSLTSITIPESVTSIAYSCFAYCGALTLVTVLPATPPTLGLYAFNGVHISFNIKVRSASVNAYKTAPGWSD